MFCFFFICKASTLQNLYSLLMYPKSIMNMILFTFGTPTERKNFEVTYNVEDIDKEHELSVFHSA